MSQVIPQIGDFGLVPIAGDVGRLIRFGQWLNGDGYADFEHAFVYVGGGRLVEGRPAGAAVVPLTTYAMGSIAWYSCPPLFGRAVASAAMDLIGTPYSFADYLALAAVRFNLPVGQALRQYVASSGHMICSQLVDAAYQRAGVQLFDDGRLPGDVTPGDLYKLMTAQRKAGASRNLAPPLSWPTDAPAPKIPPGPGMRGRQGGPGAAPN